jgi:hypothetical protein
MTANDPLASGDPDLYATDLKSLFDLETISLGTDVSVFSGRVRAKSDHWPVLYGGQVAAQCLIAATPCPMTDVRIRCTATSCGPDEPISASSFASIMTATVATTPPAT